MDPTAASLADVRGLDLGNQISVAVAKKSMDAARQEGAAALELLQSAAKVAQSGANGGRTGPGWLDVVA